MSFFDGGYSHFFYKVLDFLFFSWKSSISKKKDLRGAGIFSCWCNRKEEIFEKVEIQGEKLSICLARKKKRM